jgi:hypothetical protein
MKARTKLYVLGLGLGAVTLDPHRLAAAPADCTSIQEGCIKAEEHSYRYCLSTMAIPMTSPTVSGQRCAAMHSNGVAYCHSEFGACEKKK